MPGKEERTKEIRKAIRLLGWITVSERIQRIDDREIFRELSEEFGINQRAREDKMLEKHHIKF